MTPENQKPDDDQDVRMEPWGHEEPDDLPRHTWGQRLPDRVLWVAAGLAITHGIAFFAGALLT